MQTIKNSSIIAKQTQMAIIGINTPPEIKVKLSDDKYIKVPLGSATDEERTSINGKVQRGEVKMSHFAVDGNKSYHYYLILKQ